MKENYFGREFEKFLKKLGYKLFQVQDLTETWTDDPGNEELHLMRVLKQSLEEKPTAEQLDDWASEMGMGDHFVDVIMTELNDTLVFLVSAIK
jgi:hypothetical protein